MSADNYATQRNGRDERSRLAMARLIILLSFLYFFAAPFMGLVGAEPGTVQQISIAVIALISLVANWAYGSSLGSANKQADAQKIMEKLADK